MSAPDRFPPAYPPIAVIVALHHFILQVLIGCGIARHDLPDVAQNVIVGAWRAIESGRFRPDPALPIGAALRPWLAGIAWRQAAKHRNTAHVRRELAVADPWAVVGEAFIELDAQLDAREALRVLVELPEHHREILIAVTDHASLVAYAAARGVNPNTAANRLRIARAVFAERLQRLR